MGCYGIEVESQLSFHAMKKKFTMRDLFNFMIEAVDMSTCLRENFTMLLVTRFVRNLVDRYQ